LSKDPSETKNVYIEYPDIVKEIKNLANIKRTEIGDDLKNISGRENRPVGVIN
jgi:DNA-directed RNA polymerase delta subunit